jgi:hypothetical protein
MNQEKPNLIKAIISVMNDVKGIEKSMTIGTGQMSYKGVPDKEVKKIIGQAMAKNGLCILPIGITPTIKIERWDELDYNGKMKTKQSVFTEVYSTFLLMHESGESQEICGYGHGVDPQDKGAGKATTYALKYALLYSFLVPTGDIDDADAIHSNEIQTKPQAKALKPQVKAPATAPSQFDEEFKILINNVKMAEDLEKLKSIWDILTDDAKANKEIQQLFKHRKLEF